MYLFEQGKGNGSRCQSERDIVCQRVKFFSYGRRYVQQAGGHSVEEVERSPQHDKKQG